MTQASTPDLLAAIVAATRKTVEARRARTPRAALELQAQTRVPRGDRFYQALQPTSRINVIAECKRRSPSRGILRSEYDPVNIARAYERAGAAAISVLTEPAFFDGALEHLQAVRTAVGCPLLRKDFIVDEYQLVEAVVCGADAVLLIVSALSTGELRELHGRAAEMGLAVLVEVHDIAELERAVAAGARIIGVNNRNLRTLDVDTRASEAVASRMPQELIAVSESGLSKREDVAQMRALGYRALLVGERLMTAPDPGAALLELMS